MSRVPMAVTSHGDIQGEPTTGVWFSAFSAPFERIRRAGSGLTVASPLGGPAPVDPRGYPRADTIAGLRDALERLNGTRPLAAVRAIDHDGIFAGGHGPMFDLSIDRRVKTLVADFCQSGSWARVLPEERLGALDETLVVERAKAAT